MDDEPRYVDLTYRDQDTPVVTYSADWQNRRQKVQVNVLKKKRTVTKSSQVPSLVCLQQKTLYLQAARF